MWIPWENWAPSSSFTQPVKVPLSDPTVAPLVTASWGCEWTPYIVGALMQLTQPTTWQTSDPAVLADVLARATDLIALFGNVPACPPVGTGLIWVVNADLDTLSQLHANGASAGPPISNPFFSNPVEAAVVGAEVWVTSNSDDRIIRLNFDGTSAGPDLAGTAVRRPAGIAVVGTQVWVSMNRFVQDGVPDTITRFIFDGSNPFSDLVSTLGENWQGIANIGTEVWVVNQADISPGGVPSVDRFNPDGTMAAPPFASGSFSLPSGIIQVDSLAWVTNSGFASNISTFDMVGAFAGVLSPASLSGPVQLAAVGADIWIANSGFGSVTVVDHAGAETAISPIVDSSFGNRTTGVVQLS